MKCLRISIISCLLSLDFKIYVMIRIDLLNAILIIPYFVYSLTLRLVLNHIQFIFMLKIPTVIIVVLKQTLTLSYDSIRIDNQQTTIFPYTVTQFIKLKSMKGIVCIFVVILQTWALHWHHNQQYNLSAELEKVTAQQKQFEQQFLALRKEFDQIDDSLKKSVNPTDRISILETSLLQWRQDVFDLSKTVIPAFNLSQCGCEALTSEQKSNLLNHVERIKQNVEQLSSKAEKLQKCDKVSQVLLDAKKQRFFLESMKEILSSNCQKSFNIGPTIFQTNLYANNWILGNLTTNDLVQLYNNRALAYDNITNCPISAPFYDGKRCITCPSDNPIFNIQTMKCIQCSSSENYDNSQKRCLGNQFNTNIEAGNVFAPSGYKPIQGYSTCPSQKPYFNGKQCITCTGSQNIFNLSSKSCMPSPQGKVYDKASMGFRSKGSGSTNNTGPNNETVNQSNAVNWFSNQTTNQSGTSNQSSQNVSWTGQKFNTNPFAKGVISNGSIPKDSKLPNCPMQNPYFDGTQCINCYPPKNLFNLTSNLCSSCGANQIYSPDSLSCEQGTNLNNLSTINSSNRNDSGTAQVSNLANLRWIVNDHNPQRIYEEFQRMLKNPSSKKCLSGKQFFNGEECIGCSAVEIFNFDTKKCQKCPDDKKFSINLHRCVKPTGTNEYQTNPVTSGNIILDGIPLMQTLKVYKDNKLKYPNILDCPRDKPFFDGISCIACNSQFSYFNLQRKLCQNCSANSNYNSQSKQCESTEGKIIYQGPTIEKMLAGIF